MSSRLLPIIVENASFVLTGVAPKLRARNAERDRVLAYCTQYRRRGIALMLQKGDAAALHRDLQRSGTAYAEFLQWAKDADRTASKAVPFFDAIACGDNAAAASIAAHTAGSVHADEEYEDDFLYFRWLMGRFALGRDGLALAPLLTRYEAILDGAEDARFRICQALDKGDAVLFAASLCALIETRADDYLSGIEADQIVEEEWATEGKVCVEAIALIRFATGLGFELESDYKFVPSLAVATRADSFDARAWSAP